MKVLVADDHSILRKGIRQVILSAYPGADVVEAENGNQVIDQLGEQEWSLLILDISMPGANGLDVLRETKDFSEKLPVLVLTMHPEAEFGVTVMRAGARGYLSKEAGPEVLKTAIDRVLSGETFVSAELARLLSEADKETVSKQQGAALLSQRESAVMRLLYEGHPVKEIGARLELNPKTVSTYRHRILTKLGVTSNQELVQYILKHKLL